MPQITGFALSTRGCNGIDDCPKRVPGQDVRQAVKKGVYAGAGFIDTCEIGLLHFAAALGERDGLQVREIYWRNAVIITHRAWWPGH